MRWNLLNKVQPVNLSRKETSGQIFSCKFCKSFQEYFFKYTSGQLLLEEHWISQKWCQYLPIPINVSNACYQKEFVLFSFSRLLTVNKSKFLQKILSKFFRYLGFFCLLNFNEYKETAISSKFYFCSFQQLLDVKSVQASNYLRQKRKQKNISQKLSQAIPG